MGHVCHHWPHVRLPVLPGIGCPIVSCTPLSCHYRDIYCAFRGVNKEVYNRLANADHHGICRDRDCGSTDWCVQDPQFEVEPWRVRSDRWVGPHDIRSLSAGCLSHVSGHVHRVVRVFDMHLICVLELKTRSAASLQDQASHCLYGHGRDLCQVEESLCSHRD